MSRLHLLFGITSYLTAPLWLSFLIVGIAISLQAQFIRPEYFPGGFSLFPQWPAQDPVRAAWVFAATMGLLLLPKVLGYLSVILRPHERHGCGGRLRVLASVVIETLLAGLIAPVMMAVQSRTIFQILTGKDSGWESQQRDDGKLPLGVLARQYSGPTILGLLLASAAYAVSWPLFLWMTPVVVGLALAIPLAAVTADQAVGRRVKQLGLLMTPEERDPPMLLRRPTVHVATAERDDSVIPLLRMLRDTNLAAAHRAMLRPRIRERGDIDVALVVGIAKLKDIESLDEALSSLTRSELTAVLGDRHGLDRLVALATGDPAIDAGSSGEARPAKAGP
jgi:membrane glycosyltransferase